MPTQNTRVSNATGIAPWRFSTRGVAIRLFVTCWLIYGLHFATNTVREIYPALSLGDRLSFDVSEYAGLHPDIFGIQGRGTFINNNPGASMLGAVPYALARPVIDPIVERVRRERAAAPEQEPREYDTIYPMAREFYRRSRERGLDVKFGLGAGVMQSFLMAPLSALSAVLIFYILLGMTGRVRASLWLALLYALATPVFYRTAQLNQNLLVAHFALFAFVLLWGPWRAHSHLTRPRYFLAGLLAGWTVVLDYSGLVVVAALGLYAFARWLGLPTKARSSIDLARFAAGVALPVAVLIGYQWSSFGHPFYPAQTYMPPATFSDQGYRGMSWPRLDLLWETAFGMRFGLFTSAPLLVLALHVPGWLPRRGGSLLIGRREALFVLLFSVSFFLFCAANQYGRMQFNTGVRHVVPVVPFLFLIAAGVLLRMPRPLAVLVGAVSIYWSWCLAMYRDVEQGLGVLESLRHVTFGGFGLPWLTTLQKMGHVSESFPVIVPLALCAAFLLMLWNVGAKRLPQRT